jgi:hypothetical protein
MRDPGQGLPRFRGRLLREPALKPSPKFLSEEGNMLREFENPGFIRAIIYVGAAAVCLIFTLGALGSPAQAWSEFLRIVR